MSVKEITVSELKTMQDNQADFQLIDVREPYEYEIANLGGELVPLATILDFAENISRDKKVVVHCRSGARSANAISILQNKHGFENLYNLKGGILAYADEIDNSLTKY
jgi:adenylyltransferase/sulfurtransferase